MSETGGLSAAVMQLVEQHGGLPGLLQKLSDGGLGDVVSSWISPGDNAPISPAQLHNALGPDTVRSAAENNGMSSGDLMRQLAQALPQMVNHTTPDGLVPAEPGGWLNTAMGFLRNR